MKLSKEDLYFVTAYYIEELNGKYPLVETVDGKTNETMFYLLRHYVRSILKLRSTKIEMQIIDLLRNSKPQEITRTAFSLFPEWRMRADSHDRILCVGKNLLKIRALSRNQTEEPSIKEEKDLPDRPKFDTIEDYETTAGKRFRMKKEQKERGLTREQAFKELYGG
jgi:hypothetical protein